MATQEHDEEEKEEKEEEEEEAEGLEREIKGWTRSAKVLGPNNKWE